MVFRDSQRFEVIVVEFDLGAFDDGEAHRDECLEDVAKGAGDGVEAADGPGASGERDIDPASFDDGELLSFDLFFFRCQRPLERRLQPVGGRSQGAPFFEGKRAEAAQHLREASLASEVGDSPGVKRFRVLGGGEIASRLRFDIVEVGGHKHRNADGSGRLSGGAGCHRGWS